MNYAAQVPDSLRSFHSQWSKDLSPFGFTQISNAFLSNYASLKPEAITHGEAMFLVHLFQHKWDAKAPFPGYRTLSKMMGISEKSVKRYARTLEQKGFLKRMGRAGRSNRFDLSPLISALEEFTSFQKPYVVTGDDDDLPY